MICTSRRAAAWDGFIQEHVLARRGRFLSDPQARGKCSQLGSPRGWHEWWWGTRLILAWCGGRRSPAAPNDTNERELQNHKRVASPGWKRRLHLRWASCVLFCGVEASQPRLVFLVQAQPLALIVHVLVIDGHVALFVHLKLQPLLEHLLFYDRLCEEILNPVHVFVR